MKLYQLKSQHLVCWVDASLQIGRSVEKDWTIRLLRLSKVEVYSPNEWRRTLLSSTVTPCKMTWKRLLETTTSHCKLKRSFPSLTIATPLTSLNQRLAPCRLPINKTSWITRCWCKIKATVPSLTLRTNKKFFLEFSLQLQSYLWHRPRKLLLSGECKKVYNSASSLHLMNQLQWPQWSNYWIKLSTVWVV